MPTLPASVRLSLWGTRVLSRAVEPAAALSLATPDADAVTGGLADLGLWRDLGERAVLVALPAPGDPTSLPRGSRDFTDAALEAGECVYVPALGGALVPEAGAYGGPGDEGLHVAWTAYETDPVPAHVVDAWSLRDAETSLRSAMLTATERLDALATQPWASSGLRELVDERVGAGRWGLPDQLGPRACRVIRQAAVLETVAGAGLDHLHDATTRQAGEIRADVLRGLRDDARRALTAATCAAALGLGGLREGRVDA